MPRSLAIDAGQTGIRTRFDGVGDPVVDEFPGLRTDLPLMPQLAQVVGAIAERVGRIDSVSVGTTGLTAEQTDPVGLLTATHAAGVTRTALAHDSVTSYLGAIGDGPGAVIASGTGVVTLAVGASAVARVDGWGYLMADAGSGYWIGREALDAAMRAHDGRAPHTALLDLMRMEFPDVELAYIELQSDPGRVRRVASYSRWVTRAAADGDATARTICARAGRELALSVTTGLRRVGVAQEADADAPDVCALGGVFLAPEIAEPFLAVLAGVWPAFVLRAPQGTGLDGAALLPSVASDSPLHGLIARAEV